MAEVTNQATATMHTYLLYKGSEGGSWEKLVDIKDYPAMGGSPEQIETTTLSNEKSTFVTGVQSMPTFEFLANYTVADFNKLNGLQAGGNSYAFALAFGKPSGTSYGSLGAFTWKGQLSVWVEGGSVNAAREMRISISVTEEVEYNATLS